MIRKSSIFILISLISKIKGFYILGYNIYFSIEKVTWADLAIADLIGLISEYDQDVMSKAPELAELANRVNTLPRIKKWIEERPKTFM